ncbi:MAG: hypothetical protein ACTSRL_03610 [Candidatus Helarchaeota archaeon]
MDISILRLIERKTELVAALSEKFHISLNGAKEFMKLAIIEWVKTNYTLKISDNFISGAPDALKQLETDVMKWDSDDFDEDDFQVIGYCKFIK